MDDPAKTATNQQKAQAFSWLKRVSASGACDAKHASVLVREIIRLQSALHQAVTVDRDSTKAREE